MTPFRTQRRVDFCDTDLAGIVHFSNYYRYMETAEIAFLRSKGLSVTLHWEGVELGFPRVSASCDYARPALFDDVLDIDVILEKLGNKSVTYRFEFTRDGTLIARGMLTSVCCILTEDGNFKSIEVPASLRQKLQS